MMHVHDLAGCAPVPLAHYLKALGILRLVSEQADPEARGWWHGELFRLMTRLSRAELEEFFLERYEPTAIVNPWGGRSGFYAGGSEKRARAALSGIEQRREPRFASFQQTTGVVRSAIASTTGGAKPTDKKEQLVVELRKRVRGAGLKWLDSVAAVLPVGNEASVRYPALFGTGGNEGSGSYTSAFMAALVECLVDRAWSRALPVSLFSAAPEHGSEWDQSMGQFMPGSGASPWDFILAFEGGCVIRNAVTARSSNDAQKWMSSPFYVAPLAFGYQTGARLDEHALNKGKELPGRGEQWFPLWPQPMALPELEQLFAEGRCVVGRRAASDGWSMARAVGTLGVRRGIREFVRFGYLQRRNLATHLAVPLGRHRVAEHLSVALCCLDDVDGWLRRLRSVARDKGAPTRLQGAVRRLGDPLFAVASHADEPLRWQSVLGAIADVEAVLVTGSGFRAGPAPRLRPEWVQAADDGSPEIRLALACALQASSFSRRAGWPVDPVRHHWLPLKQGRFATTGTATQSRLLDDPRVVLQGRSGLADAAALVERRLVEASQRGTRSLGLVPGRRAAARPSDLATLLAGRVDLDRTMRLARALMALDGRAWAASPVRLTAPPDDSVPEPAWMALRLALLPWSPAEGAAPAADPAIFRRLTAGDGASAVELALRRLRGAGIRAVLRCAAAAPETARLWAAALAFPINLATSRSFLRCLDPKEMPAS